MIGGVRNLLTIYKIDIKKSHNTTTTAQITAIIHQYTLSCTGDNGEDGGADGGFGGLKDELKPIVVAKKMHQNMGFIFLNCKCFFLCPRF